jgi:tetratricopeptide (TPR) repeat protein
MHGELLRTAVPRPVRCDLTKLAIDSADAFVLSQVDGRLTVDDLAAVCGLSIDRVQRTLLRLREVGAVELGDRPPRRRSSVAIAKPTRPRRPDPRGDGEGHDPGVLGPTVVPRVVDRGRVASHAVDAQEAFVLAQIDGRTAIEDIVLVTGVSAFDISVVLTPLIREGAVEIDEPRAAGSPRSRASVKPRARTVAPEAAKRKGRATVAPRSERHAGRGSVAPSTRAPPRRPTRKSLQVPVQTARKAAAEDDTCELDAALCTRIDTLLLSLSTATLYALLDVPRDANKKAIKRAYFELAAGLHPDRHFRKRLGLYKAKLSTVFVRITAAHDTLIDPVKRAAYDATLPPPPVPKPAPEPARRKPSTIRMPRVPVFRTVPPDAPNPSKRHTDPPARAAPTAPAAMPPPDALKRFFADKVGKAGRDRARVFVDAADGARASGNFASAAQHYELALQACGSPEIQAALDEVRNDARQQTHARDVKRANSAEKEAHWDEAVVRYGKAYDAVPTAQVAERLAHALCMQGTDPRRAVKMAEDAVLREPSCVLYRVTLGWACVDAGLWARAKGESDRALAAAPRDEGALALAARLKAKA